MTNLPERRRSPRLTLEVPVRVVWRDHHGIGHEQQSHTAIVNRHGALLYLPQPLPLDKVVRLTNDSNGRTTLARVVWTGDTLPDGTARVGIELTTPVTYEFWGTMAVHLWEEEEQSRRNWLSRVWTWMGKFTR